MPDTPRITLNDGRTMPQLGLGVFQTPADQTAAIVAAAIEAGYEAVDTAAIYGNEAGVGEAVRGTDAKIFVTTKLWTTDFGRDRIAPAFEASMKRLTLSWLDLWLMHWPVPPRDLYLENWQEMIRLRDGSDGRLRSIGVSNFKVEHLRRIIDATGVVPAVNQIELHPYMQQPELRAFHAEHGIVTTSWSPLGRGATDDPAIAAIAAKHGKTPAQVVIRWHVDLGLTVIPKTATPARLAENIAVFDFALDEDDMARIAALDRGAAGRTGPDPETFKG